MRSCYECFYEKDDKCKRYPPTINSDFIAFPPLSDFDTDDGCGEFELKAHIKTQEFGELMDKIERGE